MVQSWSDFNTQIYFFVVYPLQSIKNGIEKLSEKGNGFARKIVSSYIYNLLKLLWKRLQKFNILFRQSSTLSINFLFT